MTIQTATRLIGSAPNYQHVAIPVTSRERMKNEEIARATSPLDALVQYCDKHGWHIRRYARDANDPTALHAIIRPDWQSIERLRVLVWGRAVAGSEIRGCHGMRFTGQYDVMIRPYATQPNAYLPDSMTFVRWSAEDFGDMTSPPPPTRKTRSSHKR